MAPLCSCTPIVRSWLVRQNPLQAIAQMHGHVVAAQFIFQGLGHFGIEQGQHLRLQFHQRRLEASAHQLFDHFQADITRPDHDRLLRDRSLHRRVDAIHVVDVAECEDVAGTHAVQRGDDRRGAGREDQLVVRLLVISSRHLISDRDRLGLTVDAVAS